MSKFVIVVNGGLFVNGNNKNVFTKEEVVNELTLWSNGDTLVDEDGEEVSVDDLIECGNCGESVDIYCESMVEMGDDFVSLSVVELSF